MTDLVASGKAIPKGKKQKPILLSTTFEDYLQKNMCLQTC